MLFLLLLLGFIGGASGAVVVLALGHGALLALLAYSVSGGAALVLFALMTAFLQYVRSDMAIELQNGLMARASRGRARMS